MWTKESIKIYERQLESNRLPVIFNIEHLRRLIGVEKKYFYKLTNSVDASYISRFIDKRNGGKRKLLIPGFNLNLFKPGFYIISCIHNLFLPLLQAL